MDALRSLLEWVVSLIGPFVAPDWAALIKLIPIGILGIVAAFYGWVFVRYRRAGRRQIGMPPLPAAAPPAGIHLPGPSLAPLLISVAAAALFFSVAMGGAALAVSAVAMVLALVAWGREAVREYDAIGAGAKFAKLNYLISRDLADGDQPAQWYAKDYFGDLFAPKAAKAAK